MPSGSWTLVGGLMVQLHALHAGQMPPRATTDVDMVLHIETDRISWAKTCEVLQSKSYALQEPHSRTGPVHRFLRQGDLGQDVVDVLIADHVSPTAYGLRGGGQNLMRIPGATSALRKTVNCRVIEEQGEAVIFSVPNVLGALTLKGGAYLEDSRDRARHLEDAVVLLDTVTDADAIVEDITAWTQHDQGRIQALMRNLPVEHESWLVIRDGRRRIRAQQSLKILADGPAS